jgi:uncharacterized membrane protein HdeD (DUF308 family)
MIESIPEKEIERDKNLKLIFIRMVVFLIFGLSMLFWPKMGLNLLSLIIGLLLTVQGIFAIVLSFINRINKQINTRVIVHKIIQILVGILFVLRPGWVVNLGIHFLFVSSGVIIIAGNLLHILRDNSVKKQDSAGPIIFILMGLIMIFAPFFTAELFIRLLGLITLLFSMGDLYIIIKLWKKPMSLS